MREREREVESFKRRWDSGGGGCGSRGRGQVEAEGEMNRGGWSRIEMAVKGAGEGDLCVEYETPH